jgi:hypothetical protein
VAGRASAFADAEIIKMANSQYIPVAGDDWYQRRRQDAEGEFFRQVANQGPRKSEDGASRQGIYCFTADGQLLAYRNAGHNADVMREVFRQGLAARDRLSADRRQPGAVEVGDAGKEDRRYSRTAPAGGLIATVCTRILDFDIKLGYCKGKCAVLGGDKAARDHLWLTAAEAASMVPSNATVGASAALPAAVTERILRFHLIDNTRGEPPMWRREDIRSRDLKLTVTAASPEKVNLQLSGTALLANGPDAATAKNGFDARLFGELRWNRKAQQFERFDIVAIGEHWGEGTFTGGARPGRQPLAIAFELAGNNPVDRVPPQAARQIGEYFGK